jgi:hypothetical protein
MWLVVVGGGEGEKGAFLPPSQASGYANIIVRFVERAKVEQIVRSLSRLYKEEKQKTATTTQTSIAYIHRERDTEDPVVGEGSEE